MISVIVPVYNVDKYLERCVESIQNQSYKNIEILLIDDGSKDNSGDICDKLASKDSRIIVIHKENGGLSSARNTGLDIAKGQWISFVDSDDYIHRDMLNNLHNCATCNGVAMAICGFTMVDEDGKYLKLYIPTQQVLEGIELQRYFFEEGKGKEYVWNKLYNVDIFKDIRFPIGKLYEDIFILPEVLLRSKKGAFISWEGYYYTQRNSGISKDLNISRQMDGLEAKQSKLAFMEKYYPILIPKAKEEIIESCCWLLYKTYEVKGYDFKENKLKILNAFHREKIGLKRNGINIKIAIFLIDKSPWLFHKIYKIVVEEKRKFIWRKR